MGAFDSAGFLVSLISMSVSVSLLLGLLALLKERLLTRYRARTLYLLGILLTALLLFPWRPALLLPRVTLPAEQVVETTAFTEDASLPSTPNAQASAKANDQAVTNMSAGVSPEAAAVKNSDDTERQTGTSPAVAPSAHRRSGIPWVLVLFAVWVAGTLTVLLFQIFRHARFLRLIRRWQSPLPKEIRSALEEQCAYLRITPPPAYTAPCVQSPTVMGLLRPVLLLPDIGYDPQQLSLMLAHELIHLKHGHLWGKALGCLVSAVHWFNPMMPYLMCEMGLLCEMACDEAVLTRKEPEHRSAYVGAILNAVQLTKAVRTPLCSPFDGGVKQMNRIKQRIALMTPFRPRRAGAGLIVCTLLLALFTGSVLADKVSASAFSITENDYLIPASEYMPQADYDLLMSMQTPGWEELSTEEYAKQITPQLPKLKAIFDRRWLENRFMRHLQYSVAEARNSLSDSYTVRWNTLFLGNDQIGCVSFYCELNWSYLENAKLTNGERNRLLDDSLIRADRAVRALNITEIRGAVALKNAGDELGVQLNETAKELGGKSLSIWFTGVLIGTDLFDDSQIISREQRKVISLLTPEGYLDQTVTEYQAFLEKNKDDFDQDAQVAIEYTVNRAVNEAYEEMTGNPTRSYIASVDLSLMPAWTIRGSIDYTCQLYWKTVDPDHVTVGERHDAISKLITRIRDTAANAMWEAPDWESFDKALKECLPMLAQEESTPALTFTVSEVGLELDPLGTEEYVHSEPTHVLKAFANACRDQDTAKMAAVCAPLGTDAAKAGGTDAREELLKSLIEMKPYHWTFGEVKKVSGKDDDVTVDLAFYLVPPKGTETPVEERKQVHLTQIDGKWYLVLESLEL
jgi:beta-lactamase regulating signal transducer with metallopeptidase domain